MLDRFFIACMVVLVIAIIALGYFGIRASAAARAACAASGRAYVVDHYTMILMPVGKTLVPVQSPVYKCVER